MDSTTSLIALEKNATKVKASTIPEPMVVDTNASILTDSTATASTTESNVTETSVNASITSEKKATDPATDVRPAVEATFELFPKLPAELRVKIWKLVPAPRCVVVCFNVDRRKRTNNFRSSTPSILHACQESRQEALKIYHRAFDSKWASNGAYFNFKIDTLVFGGNSPKQREFFLSKLKPNDLSRIERIGTSGLELEIVSRFVGLKEVIYVVDCGYANISSCPRDDSIHSPEELSEELNPHLLYYVNRTQNLVSYIKRILDKSEEGSKLSITQGFLYMKADFKRGYSRSF